PRAAARPAAGGGFVARRRNSPDRLSAAELLSPGEPVWPHALGIASSLADIGLDAPGRAAGILFAMPKRLGATDRIKEVFGAEISGLAEGVERLYQLRVATRANPVEQNEVLRKMVLGMVEDVRVVLIRLASRTQPLRWFAKNPSPERTDYAKETLDIYSPLANRLGVFQLKWELEDLSFRFLEPELYKRIAKQLDERRAERESFIAEAIAALATAVRAAGIAAEISGRPKHIYSIYTKMRQKGLEFSELYDVRGVRVLVGAEKDCYAVLGIVHDLWQAVPEEFDDYISRPKSNNYRSLHTAVAGPDGRALEVQIRTHEMHRHAELGVAAHWRYKEGKRGPAEAVDDRIAWLRQVLAWRDEVVDSAEWVEPSKRAARDDTVYVLTPQGRVIDLARGATPIHFAHPLHTPLRHR